MVKIGAELPKLSQKKLGVRFFGPPCMCSGFLLSVVEDRPIHIRGALQTISLLLFIELPALSPNTDTTQLNI